MERGSPIDGASEDEAGRVDSSFPMERDCLGRRHLAFRSLLHRQAAVIAVDGAGLVAIEKPSGLLSHPNGVGVDRRAVIFAPYDGVRRAYVPSDGSPPIWLVNRLDSATGGVLLLALTGSVARAAMESFQLRRVRKTYYAVVRSCASCCRWRWRDRLQVRRSKNTLRVCRGGDFDCDAITDAAAIESRTFGPVHLALIRLCPLTGRTHQLRFQCASRSMPIVGDRTYGDFALNRYVGKVLSVGGLQLLSAEIEFSYAFGGAERQFFARSGDVGRFMDWGRFSSSAAIT
ncbi:MAG: RNA pseudouridine synthase [Puniceicoccales bacterium]|jgi:23S rRNA-/tRNA-specific pseudouridylate synthase|nr:RNA pseudouridine synthase [Puniceicoccales bacterium]